MPFHLPANTPLHTDRPSPLVWKNGQLVAQPDVSYPSLYVLDTDLPGAAPNAYSAVKLPVVLTEAGAFTDPEWKAFADLEPEPHTQRGRRQVSDFNLDEAIDDISSGHLQWNMACAAMPRYESIIGRLFEVYADRYGFMVPRDQDEDASAGMATAPAKLFKKVTTTQLKTFDDRGRTLLDLAASQGLWEIAEWLYDQGVQLSPEAVDSGLIHQALTLTPHGKVKDPLPWLNRWLLRLEGFPLPTGELTWSRDWLRHRNSASPGDVLSFTESVAAFWLGQQPKWQGAQVSRVENLTRLQRDLLERWGTHWNHHRLDLETVEIPTRIDPHKEKPASVPLSEHWKENRGGWLDAIREIQSPLKRHEFLTAALSEPVPDKARGPRF